MFRVLTVLDNANEPSETIFSHKICHNYFPFIPIDCGLYNARMSSFIPIYFVCKLLSNRLHKTLCIQTIIQGIQRLNLYAFIQINLIYTVFHCLSHIYNHYIHTWQLSFDQVNLRLFLLYKHLYNGTNDHTLYRFCLTYYTLPVMIRHRKITPNTPMPTAMISLVAIDTFIFFLFILLFILRP